MDRDEDYIIPRCDEVLGKTALRRHELPFLLGDANSTGASTSAGGRVLQDNLARRQRITIEAAIRAWPAITEARSTR